MENRLLLTSLLTIVCALATFGNLTTTPLNQYAFFGWVNYTMTCSSTRGSGSITWFHTPVGESNNITIASGSHVYPPFDQMYWINQPTINDSNLVILTGNESSLGTFACADSEMLARAQLIMWHNTNASSNASGILIIGDVIRHSIQMSYFGNPFYYPTCYVINYPDHNYSNPAYIANLTSSKLEQSNSLITATVSYYQTLSCLYSPDTRCLVEYGQPADNLLPGSATNAITGPMSGILVAKVSCVPFITGAISGSVLSSGAILTCQLTSKLPVNYTWTELPNRTSSIGPQWTVLHGGSYQCNASFEISGRWQSVSTTVYNLAVENESLLSYTAKPLYGPIAGRTKVTLILENWSKEVANISTVYLGDFLKMTELQSDSVNNNVVMTTPNVTAALIGQPLPITIEFTPGPYNISTNLSFTYKGNPEITGINPSTFVATGGTIVNATGTQLSSVANPLIQVTIVIERGIERNTTTERSIEPCEVKAGDGSQISCRMPSVNIPDDFLQALNSLYNNRSKRDTNLMNHRKVENPFHLSRSKRYANALSLIGPNGVDQLFIYLGFILDGYQKYDNINKALPDTQILIYSPPEINVTKDIVEFDPDKDESISIKGDHMTRGCRMVDYVVTVDADVCENIDLTDNQLRCRPPKQQPQSTQNTSIYCDQLQSIYINLGFKTYQYACMKYSSRLPVLLIGLVVGLSSFVVIILLIIAIVCCCKRSRNRRNKPTDIPLDSNTAAVNEAYEPPSDQVYANAVYLRPSVQSLYADEAYIQPSDQSYANDEYEQPSTPLYANALELNRH